VKEYDFDLRVSGLSEEDAQALLELIINYVHLCTGEVSGGMKEAVDENAE
jgi:hypothetical protein